MRSLLVKTTYLSPFNLSITSFALSLTLSTTSLALPEALSP